MKDRLTRAAFVGALAVHVGVIAAGGALSPYLGRSSDSDPMRSIQVGLETPERERPQTTDHRPQTAAPIPLPPSPLHPFAPSPGLPVSPTVAPQPGAPARLAQVETRPVEQPGGALSLGSASARGDIEGLPTGQTPVGWVPGPDTGRGAGSGAGEGTGRPEPAPRVEPAPVPTPTPPAPDPRPEPTPPPPPRRVSVRVCAGSRLRPNPHCPECLTIEVAEGSEPQGTCALHKAPPPPAPPAPRPDPTPATPPPARVEPTLTAARLVRSTKPEYPPSALEGDNEGSVSLKVEVRADGTAGDVEITRSSGSRVLDAAAVKAVKHWRWEPARRGDEPVASTTRCRVRFELEE